ncbi:hypothetical protein ACQ86N_29745 [Puia sp. P3]|uniref:hypothetical protein n=1 Tax=Puia sp. P3 TaxID=3423952 RepID=UPI003D673BF5
MAEEGFGEEPANKVKRMWYHQLCVVALNISKFGHPQTAMDVVQATIRDYPPLTADNKFHLYNFMGFTYRQLGQVELAAKYYDMMLPFMDSIRNDREERDRLFSAYLDLADFYMDRGRPDLTKKYLKKGKEYAEPGQIFHVSKIHDIQYRIDSSEGNYLKALNEFRLRRLAEDSIYSLQRKNKFAEAAGGVRDPGKGQEHAVVGPEG